MRRLLPAAGTAVLAGTLLLRAVRVLENLEGVRRFYFGGGGLLWTLAEGMFFFGPYAAALSAAAALRLSGRRAGGLAAVNFCAAAFFTFEEGLTVFARAVNGSGGYVGAEPLCSALVCGVSAVTLYGALHPQEQKQEE